MQSVERRASGRRCTGSAARAGAPLIRRGTAQRAAQPERERGGPGCAAETRPPGLRRRRPLDEPAAGRRKCRLRSLRRPDDRRRPRPVAPDPLGRRRPFVRSAGHGRGADRDRRRSRPGDDGLPAPGTRHARSFAAPERFVARGSYRVVRNPMYVGVLALIVGQALLLGREVLLLWAGSRHSSSTSSSCCTRSPSSQALRDRVRGLPTSRRPLATPEPSPSRNRARRSRRPAPCSARRRGRIPRRPDPLPVLESYPQEHERPSTAPGRRCRPRP